MATARGWGTGGATGREIAAAGALALATLFAPAPAPAMTGSAGRAIDPRQDLAELTRTGRIAVSVERREGVYLVDASTVLRVELAALLAVSIDYERYPAMGMPHLREMRIVSRAPDGERLCAWVWMRHLGQSSRHYLAVRVRQDTGVAGAAAVEWTLVRREAGWPYEEATVFTRLDGAWYLEPLRDGTVYARYTVAAVLDRSVPEALLAPLVKRELRDCAHAVLGTVAREAAARPASRARVGRSKTDS